MSKVAPPPHANHSRARFPQAEGGREFRNPKSEIRICELGVCYNTPMENRALFVVRLAALAALVVIAAACTEAPVPVDPAYAAEVDAWRNQRLARLKADDGWLTLTGLYWLEPGENRFGSAPDGAVVLPDENVAEIAGLLILAADGTVVAFGEEGTGVVINGEPLTNAVLATDVQGRPDVITAGRISFYIIDRDGRLAARVKDPEANTRLTFPGIEHFDIDPAYRVEARFEPYAEPREVAIPTVLGQLTPRCWRWGPFVSRSTARNRSSNRTSEAPRIESLFLIFRDGTSGLTTYGAGRFLSADAPGDDGTTVLDFNLAYNPPCAFTPYATCPLPPPQNALDIAIEAGEQYRGEATDQHRDLETSPASKPVRCGVYSRAMWLFRSRVFLAVRAPPCFSLPTGLADDEEPEQDPTQKRTGIWFPPNDFYPRYVADPLRPQNALTIQWLPHTETSRHDRGSFRSADRRHPRDLPVAP